MANLVVHFEIHASEPQRLVDFYSQLLGWKFTQFGDVPYWTIETGEGAIGNVAGTAGHGINGGLTQRRGPKPEPGAPVMGCNFVVGVDDVDSLMARGVELGGTVALAGRGHAGRRADRLPARSRQQRLRHDLGGHVRRHHGDGRRHELGFARAKERPTRGSEPWVGPTPPGLVRSSGTSRGSGSPIPWLP